MPGEDHRRAEPVLRLVVVLHRLHGSDGRGAPGHEPERDVLERDAPRLEHRSGRGRPHPGGGAVDVHVVWAGRQLAVVEGDPVGADVADTPAPHDVLDRAQGLDLRRAHRCAAERLGFHRRVDPEEDLVVFEPVGEVLGVLRRGRGGDNLAWSCMNEPTCSRGWVNARLKYQPSRDRTQRMRPGSTPTSSSHPQVSIAGLAAADHRVARRRDLEADEVVRRDDDRTVVDRELGSVPSRGSMTRCRWRRRTGAAPEPSSPRR